MLNDWEARRLIAFSKKALMPVLDKIGKGLGVDFRVQRCTYSPSGEIRLEVIGTVAGALNHEGARYVADREHFHLPVLGTRYTYRGDEFQIIGLTAGRRVKIRRADGLTFTLQPGTVLTRLALGNIRDREEARKRDTYLGALAREAESEV